MQAKGSTASAIAIIRRAGLARLLLDSGEQPSAHAPPTHPDPSRQIVGGQRKINGDNACYADGLSMTRMACHYAGITAMLGSFEMGDALKHPTSGNA